MKQFLAAVSALLLGLTVSIDCHAGVLRAGAGKVAITPPASEFPYTVPREKSFVGVHDDIFARAIVVDDGRQRVVVVSLEVTTIIDPQGLVKSIADAANLPATNVVVLATHTHNVLLTFYHGEITNPSQPREMQRVRDGALAAVKLAIASLRPARIAWARGRAFVNANNGEEGGRKGWYDAAGSSDKSLDVLRLTGTDDKPIATILNYATHAEVMFRSVTKGGGYEVSGDLPGATSRLLEDQPGNPGIVMFTSAAEGDQLPLFKSLQPPAELPGADEGPLGWALLDVQSRRLAASALSVIATMPSGDAAATITVNVGSLTCPGQRYNVERPSGKILGISATGPVAIPLATIRINDIALAAVGADLASDIGVGIKRASPVAKTTVVTMLAGAVGYVLNDRAYVDPGHGALGSPIKPGCAPQRLPRTVGQMLSATSRR